MDVIKDDMKKTNAELKSTTDKVREDSSAEGSDPVKLRLRLLMLSYIWEYVANLTKIDANLAEFDAENIHKEPLMV